MDEYIYELDGLPFIQVIGQDWEKAIYIHILVDQK